jgi:hypothetical protein
VLGIGIRGPAKDRYLNPLLSKHHPLKESTAMCESVEERSKEEEEKGTLHLVEPLSNVCTCSKKSQDFCSCYELCNLGNILNAASLVTPDSPS